MVFFIRCFSVFLQLRHFGIASKNRDHQRDEDQEHTFFSARPISDFSERNRKMTDVENEHQNEGQGCIASDVGGTFTDFVFLNERNEIEIQKVPSNRTDPADPVRSILQRRRPSLHRHGTTVATNAVLERTGGEVAFVTTEGFQDLLQIGRQDRPDLYDPRKVKPEPFISPDHCYTVMERMGPDGEILEPLDEQEVRKLVDQIRGQDPDAVAICLLHAYANDAHEQKISGFFEGIPVSCSSEVLPEFREYERASSTVLNAYLEPKVTPYVKRLREERSNLELMKSSGGTGGAKNVMKRPLRLLLSGPAGGAIAGKMLGEQFEETHLVNVDIGGTSADISLIENGEPARTSRMNIGGRPVGGQVVDVETIGAGGGSVAWFDDGGALRVGPESAGADPGPICYGRGGERLTVTDAHFALGHIGTGTRLAEQLELSADPVLDAFERMSEEYPLTSHQIATGILDVVNSRMNRALRSIFARRGEDPKRYAFVAFGGAGPLHACGLAESLDITKIYVPRHPGVFSATGILQARRSAVRSKTVMRPFDGISDELDQEFERLIEKTRSELHASERAKNEEVQVRASLKLRYSGQSHELDLLRTDATREAFHEEHKKRYGYAAPDQDIEIVTIRVRAFSPGPVVREPTVKKESGEAEERRSPLLHDPFNQFPVYRRSHLGAGQIMDGPAIIEEPSSTLRLKEGWTMKVLSNGTLRLNRSTGGC